VFSFSLQLLSETFLIQRQIQRDITNVHIVVIGQPQSHMDFGPVVKPLGITVKKEVGKVVETSVVVRSQATREFRKRGKSPQSPKKGAQKIFEFQNF